MPSLASARAPCADISDATAIAEVQRGNREMFEVIVRRYNARLFGIGMAYLGNHAHAEDAMQNAYVSAFRHLGRFRRQAAFSTWLTRIMINECLMMLRRPSRRLERSIDVPLSDAPAEDAAAPERLNRQDLKMLLEQAIAELPRKHRAVYVLREVQQLSTADTAACLGISPDAVKVTLHRARDRLKSTLLKSAAGAELFPYPAVFCDALTRRVLQVVLAVG